MWRPTAPSHGCAARSAPTECGFANTPETPHFRVHRAPPRQALVSSGRQRQAPPHQPNRAPRLLHTQKRPSWRIQHAHGAALSRPKAAGRHPSRGLSAGRNVLVSSLDLAEHCHLPHCQATRASASGACRAREQCLGAWAPQGAPSLRGGAGAGKCMYAPSRTARSRLGASNASSLTAPPRSTARRRGARWLRFFRFCWLRSHCSRLSLIRWTWCSHSRRSSSRLVPATGANSFRGRRSPSNGCPEVNACRASHRGATFWRGRGCEAARAAIPGQVTGDYCRVHFKPAGSQAMSEGFPIVLPPSFFGSVSDPPSDGEAAPRTDPSGAGVGRGAARRPRGSRATVPVHEREIALVRQLITASPRQVRRRSADTGARKPGAGPLSGRMGTAARRPRGPGAQSGPPSPPQDLTVHQDPATPRGNESGAGTLDEVFLNSPPRPGRVRSAVDRVDVTAPSFCVGDERMHRRSVMRTVARQRQQRQGADHSAQPLPAPPATHCLSTAPAAEGCTPARRNATPPRAQDAPTVSQPQLDALVAAAARQAAEHVVARMSGAAAPSEGAAGDSRPAPPRQAAEAAAVTVGSPAAEAAAPAPPAPARPGPAESRESRAGPAARRPTEATALVTAAAQARVDGTQRRATVRLRSLSQPSLVLHRCDAGPLVAPDAAPAPPGGGGGGARAQDAGAAEAAAAAKDGSTHPAEAVWSSGYRRDGGCCRQRDTAACASRSPLEAFATGRRGRREHGAPGHPPRRGRAGPRPHARGAGGLHPRL